MVRRQGDNVHYCCGSSPWRGLGEGGPLLTGQLVVEGEEALLEEENWLIVDSSVRSAESERWFRSARARQAPLKQCNI